MDYIKLYKLTITDKSLLDKISKLGFIVYRDNSRIDGCPLYKIDMPLFYRIIKLKKIKGEDVSIYNEILDNIVIVSVMEDYIPTFIKIHNPTKTAILIPTII